MWWTTIQAYCIFVPNGGYFLCIHMRSDHTLVHYLSDAMFPLFQASFLLSAAEHGTHDKYELSNMVNKYQLLVYLADSLFEDEQYKRAEVNTTIFNLDS